MIQDECNQKRIKEELSKLLEENHRKILLEKYNELEQKLGGIGASEKTASSIISEIS